jgi:hypothetical protein
VVSTIAEKFPVAQATVEASLLGMAVKSVERLLAIRDAGISREDFVSHRSAYNFILDYLAEYGEPPTPELLGRKFEWRPVLGSFDYWLAEMVRYAKARKITELLQATFRRVNDPDDALNHLTEQTQNLSAFYSNGPRAKSKVHAYTVAEILSMTEDEAGWLVRGWLRRGALTELAGKVKVGKSTWAAHAVKALTTGSHFLGQATEPCGVVWITEENPQSSFRELLVRCQLEDNLRVISSTEAKLNGIKWQQLVREASDLAVEQGYGLLVVDNLSAISGIRDENAAGEAIAVIAPLQAAAQRDLAVLVLRHDRKLGGEVGESGRGSSAFAGAVDIVLDMKLTNRGEESEARELSSLSRFHATPRRVIIELVDGEYVLRGTVSNFELELAEQEILSMLLYTEEDALTEKEITSSVKSSRTTCQRALANLAASGSAIRAGAGKRGDPYRWYRRFSQPEPLYLEGGNENFDAL